MMHNAGGKKIRERRIYDVEARTHVESCHGVECEHPEMHETHAACALCHLGAPRDKAHFQHEDGATRQLVCNVCWEKKCQSDPTEASRLISGQALALDFDTSRVLV